MYIDRARDHIKALIAKHSEVGAVRRYYGTRQVLVTADLAQRMSELNADTVTLEEVESVLGEPYRYMRECSECGSIGKDLMVFEDGGDNYGCGTVCMPCVARALSAFDGSIEPPPRRA